MKRPNQTLRKFKIIEANIVIYTALGLAIFCPQLNEIGSSIGKKKLPPFLGDSSHGLKLGAGTGFEPVTFRL